MEWVQVVVSSTFNCEVNSKLRADMHGVYNQVRSLHSCLQQFVSRQSLLQPTGHHLNRKRSCTYKPSLV